MHTLGLPGAVRRALVLGLGCVGALGTSSALAQTPPDSVIDLPAGVACVGFDLRIEARGTVQQNRTFTDRNGNTVRFISVGKGSTLTLINLNTGSALTLQPNGSGSHYQYKADGSSILSATGHNVIIWFPTDIPAGPASYQYVGHVVVHIAPDGVWTLRQSGGRRTDLCAALGG
jgi:hypothetical protein